MNQKYKRLKIIGQLYVLFFIATVLILNNLDGASLLNGTVALVVNIAYTLIFMSLAAVFMAIVLATISVLVGASLMPAPIITNKERRKLAIYNFVEKAGGKDIYVQRAGTKGIYLEHFVVRYYDADDTWQVRHIIRNQMKSTYYWDDPIIDHTREVSAKSSQAKEQIINDLDVEIYQLKREISAVRQNRV